MGEQVTTLGVKTKRVLSLYGYRAQRVLLGRESPVPPVLSNSIPKAGSNLLLRCLELMPGLVYTRVHLDIHTPPKQLSRVLRSLHRGEFATAHLPYTPEVAQVLRQQGIASFLMVRDPRDVVVSHIYWVTHKYTAGRLHPYFRDLPDDNARLMASIRGTPPMKDGFRLEDVGTRFRSYLAWVDAGSFLLRFEDLIGPAGGGSEERQRETIRRMGDHLGLALDETQITTIAQNLFDPHSPTFRKGRIGDWRQHFTQAHKEAMKEVAGDVLIALGYETNMDW